MICMFYVYVVIIFRFCILLLLILKIWLYACFTQMPLQSIWPNKQFCRGAGLAPAKQSLRDGFFILSGCMEVADRSGPEQPSVPNRLSKARYAAVKCEKSTSWKHILGGLPERYGRARCCRIVAGFVFYIFSALEIVFVERISLHTWRQHYGGESVPWQCGWGYRSSSSTPPVANDAAFSSFSCRAPSNNPTRRRLLWTVHALAPVEGATI